MNVLYRALVVGVLFCGVVQPPDAACGSDRPNIVIFLSDDHTITDSSVYGSDDLRTPNMERLARQGMTFDRAFVVSPSCAPSRAALLTGTLPAVNGAEANHSRPDASLTKFPAYLQAVGYEVVSFGKVGHYVQTSEYGFDLARHFTYHDDVAVAEAVRWLNERDSSQPLCLFVGTNWPHVPWPEVETIDTGQVRIPSTHVDTPQTRDMRARYYEAVATMDRELGLVMDAAQQKFGEDLLMIHTSDHGAQWPFGKWTLYDEGIRTPLIVSWPGKIAAGRRTSAMVTWVDILPTVLEAAGLDAPGTIQGRSFLPVLLGDTDSHRDRVFATHSGDGNFNVYPARCVRDQRYKYIRNLHPEFAFGSHVTKVRSSDAYWPSWEQKAHTDSDAAATVRRYRQRPAEELYDLQNDPHELQNLAQQPSAEHVLTRMRDHLDEWMLRHGDQQTVFGMPELLRTGDGHPNVITLFIDDMGWADLSCFGGEDVQTRHIDQMAEEGIRFTNFYVNSPICSPSRTALTTGQYPARHRITSYLASRRKNEERGMAQWLDESAPTLAGMLSQSGYATGHFGKWHMGGQRDVGEAPLITQYGFDASLTNFEGLGPRVLPLCDTFDGRPLRRHDLGSAALGHGPVMWEDRTLITQRFVDGALRFIDMAAAAGQPFYVNVWPDDVHSPFYPPAARRGDGGKRALYLGVLKTMDEQLGRLIDRVRSDAALRENTLILLASDNGHEPGAGRGGPLRGAKGSLYEGGIRSPLIVWGPGLLAEGAAGTVNDSTILSSVDLVASLTNLCNADVPPDYQGDGEDLLAALLGLSTAQRSGPLFWRRPPDRPKILNERNPDLAIRDRQWKLTCALDGSRTELYNLGKDIGEQHNVTDRHPRIVRRLRAELLEWNRALPEDGVATGPREQQ